MPDEVLCRSVRKDGKDFGLRELLNVMAPFPQSVVHNEEAFRYLLETESKRSEQSCYSYQTLFVYQTSVLEEIIRMHSDVATKVITALSRSLRNTDYIGWYHEEFIVAGVLTVVRQESMALVSSHIQKRMADALQLAPRMAENPRIQIRVCRYHELEGVGIGRSSSCLSPDVKL